MLLKSIPHFVRNDAVVVKPGILLFRKGMIMKTLMVTVMAAILCGGVLAAEKTPEVVEKLGLKKAEVEGATIYYEPALAGQLETVKKAYQDYRDRMAGQTTAKPFSPDKLIAKKTVVLDDIYNIVGVDDPELKDRLVTVADGFLGTDKTLSIPLVGMGNIFYLMQGTTSKEYLRSGGTLPNVTYDKKTDSAESRFLFGTDQDNSSNQEVVLPVSVDEPDRLEKVLESLFSILPQQMETAKNSLLSDSIIIHEIAESAIIGRLRSNDPYRRWFTDGFANAVTYEILKRHFSEAEANVFIEAYDTKPHQDLQSQTNLKYWFIADLSMSNHPPIQQEDELISARYSFATEQARRIVEAYGIECIKKIIDQYIATGNKHPGQLLPAIQKATGDDIEKHLMVYQSFADPKEGIRFYANKMDTARAAKDYPGVIFAMLRISELQGEQPYSKDNLNLRITIAKMLHLEGHGKEATEWITEFADELCQSKNPQNRYAGGDFMIVYAMQTHQPQVALKYAQAILQSKPEDTNALMIVMITEAEQKHTQKAVELAKKICEIEPNEEHLCHAVAKDVLAKLDKKYNPLNLTDSMYEKEK